MKWSFKEMCRIFCDKINDETKAMDCARFVRDDEKLLSVWKESVLLYDFLCYVRGSHDDAVLYSDFAVYFFGYVKPDSDYRRGFCSRFASDEFNTISDAGALAIGVNGMKVSISNHFGDDYNRVAVFDKADNQIDWALSLLFPYSEITVQGHGIEVYGYDCGNEVVKVLDGMWHVYSDDRYFALVKWSD